MKNFLFLFLVMLAFTTSSIAQGSTCTDATEISTDGDYAGDVTGFATQYWYINPSEAGMATISISSASSCGTVLDIQAFGTSQTDACIPGGAGANGRIVSNWASCGGGSTGSSINLPVAANQFYYFKVSGFFVGEPYSINVILPGALPVNLIDQQVSQKGRTAVLEWSTASEINNSHFSIQHSIDGRSFSKIGQIEGAQFTSAVSNYQFIHEQASRNNYYRILQYDNDGHANTFPVMNLQMTIQEEALKLYFGESQLVLNYHAVASQDFQLKLINTAGQILYQQALSITEGNNQFLLENTNELPQGIYFAVLQSPQALIQTSVFKQ